MEAPISGPHTETPYDLVNERALLGACLVDRDAITVARNVVSIEDFFLEKHAQIYTVLLDLVDRRIPPDLATVAGELRGRHLLDSVGGLSFLGELSAEVPTAVHVEYYAQKVAQTSAQRRVVDLGAQIQIRARQGGDVGALFEELQAMVEVTKTASTPKANWSEAVVPARLIYNYKFEQEPFVIEDILPAGTFLLTGKPKTRKSWLALNYAWAVASGGKALGRFQASQGDALYIDLEMGAARLHKRMHVVSPEAAPPKGFQFATKWPRVGEGFESWMRDYLRSHPFTRLVVIDTLVGIRARRLRYEDPYEADKNFTQALTNLTQEFRIAMLLIHHSRKADGSDVTDDASGSTGLTGGVDNYAALRLSRDERGAGELLLRGRDIELDGDLNLRWDARLAQWNATEDRVMLTPQRSDVMGLLEDRPGLKVKEIALILKREEGGTQRLLSDMKKAGLVFNSGARWYIDGDEDAVGAEE
ncbi:MAG: AAA family ATPase [Chloroflexaceae bacterium]|nr:AAA family ATPase [Chloroflexaceae bacterium]